MGNCISGNWCDSYFKCTRNYNIDNILDTTNLSIEETVNSIQNNNNFILK